MKEEDKSLVDDLHRFISNLKKKASVVKPCALHTQNNPLFYYNQGALDVLYDIEHFILVSEAERKHILKLQSDAFTERFTNPYDNI